MNGFNFTESVRRLLAVAREEAARLHHEYVGTEHILLGMVGAGDSVAIVVLRELGADPLALRRRVGDVVRAGRSSTTPGRDLPYTSRAKMVLELAMKEAKALGHSYVGSEHILLGLLAEGKGIAAQIFFEAGVTLDATRSKIVQVIGAGPARVVSPGEGPLADLRQTPLDHVELIIHYRDGRRWQSSFATAEDAADFLRSATTGGGGAG